MIVVQIIIHVVNGEEDSHQQQYLDSVNANLIFGTRDTEAGTEMLFIPYRALIYFALDKNCSSPKLLRTKMQYQRQPEE